MSVAEPMTVARAGGWNPSSDAAELADLEVVERVRAGETGLFEVLMRRYNQRLYRVVWSILLDAAEAEDVIQDAYVRAFQHLDQFEGRSQFSTWLTKIAIYEASARRKKRRRLVALDTLEPYANERLMAAETESPPSAEERLFTRDLRGLLERAVAALPPIYRQVFVLREVEGLSTGETADALGLSRTAAKVRLFRARRLLRERIEQLTEGATGEILSFAGARCDRIVSGVLVRIGAR